MTNIIAPTAVQRAVRSVEDSLLGEDSQTFWSETGAVVLTDSAVYEIYLYDGNQIIVQQATMEAGRGWEDVTEDVAGNG